MINTNGLSPLMQAAVGGEEIMSGSPEAKAEDRLVSGQYLRPGEEPGTYLDDDKEQGYTDPNKYVEIDENGLVVDNDYQYIVNEENVIIGVKKPSPMEMLGGVGGPMKMASPYKNYQNPQDYKAFNFGNKPTPFNKHKKGKY